MVEWFLDEELVEVQIFQGLFSGTFFNLNLKLYATASAILPQASTNHYHLNQSFKWTPLVNDNRNNRDNDGGNDWNIKRLINGNEGLFQRKDLKIKTRKPLRTLDTCYLLVLRLVIVNMLYRLEQ